MLMEHTVVWAADPTKHYRDSARFIPLAGLQERMLREVICKPGGDTKCTLQIPSLQVKENFFTGLPEALTWNYPEKRCQPPGNGLFLAYVLYILGNKII